MKAFADDKINVLEMMIFLSYRVANIVEIGGNAGYQNFLLFPQCFQKPYFSGPLKLGLCGEELNTTQSLWIQALQHVVGERKYAVDEHRRIFEKKKIVEKE